MAETNKIYTAEDFQRYHSGAMSANEMHALEKAALEDPFLADALDGYAYSQNIESDIAELQSRLEEKQKKKNLFSISSIGQNVWWRIAALFIVIVGGGYLFYKINYGNKETSLAKNEIKNNKPQSDSIIFNKKDTVTTKEDIALETQPASAFAQKERKSLPHERSLIEKEVYSEKKSEPALAEPKSDSALLNNKTENLKKDYYAQAAPKYLLKGKVTDEKGNPVGFATIKDNNSNKAVVTDTTGKFLLQSSDSNTTATVSVVGYATKNVALQKDEESIIAMNKRNKNLDEVVVTGYGQTKHAKESVSASKGLMNKVAGVEISDSIPEPIGGRDKFDEYVKENQKPQLDENNERISGEVALSFIINKKGRPYNIKVVKSSCEPCEKEAIRLLQSGPDWAGKNNQRGTVIIKFK